MESQKGISAKVKAVTSAIRKYAYAARFRSPTEQDEAELLKAIGKLIRCDVQRVPM